MSAMRLTPLVFTLTFTLTLTAAPPPGMVRIPAGVYRPVVVVPGQPDAIPVAAFWLDERPVTNAGFLAFVKANPRWRRSRVPRLLADGHYLGDWAGDLSLGPRAPGAAPVVDVSWFAARAYAHWAGKRLPTTAEWERAAAAGYRGPDGRHESGFEASALAWFTQQEPAVLPASGSGRANFFGARDLLDLVWEWVDDFNSAPAIGGGSGGLSCAGAAAGARDPSDYPAFMRLALRSSLRGNYALSHLGFRCAEDRPPRVAANRQPRSASARP